MRVVVAASGWPSGVPTCAAVPVNVAAATYVQLLAVWTQPVGGEHESAVQGLPSSQSRMPVQWPTPSQASGEVHGLPSLHAACGFVLTQVGLQESHVSVLPSSHCSVPSTMPLPQPVQGPNGTGTMSTLGFQLGCPVRGD